MVYPGPGVREGSEPQCGFSVLNVESSTQQPGEDLGDGLGEIWEGGRAREWGDGYVSMSSN